ncbi:MAG: ATP-dependent 6-phosphofructokinase [Myxococcaceae bacterium]
MQPKVIGILTGGGDCPGLNSAIKSITQMAEESGFRVLGIQDGWRGLSAESPKSICVDSKQVTHIDRQGGTILGTSRTNPYKITNGIEQLKANWKKLNLEALVAIGGEDTLGVAARLFEEEKLAVIGLPKTIDFDLPGTEYTLGFESALAVIMESIDRLRSTAESHARIIVVEVMGRHAGHLALQGGIAAGAQVILLPEYDFEISRVLELLEEHKKQGHRYSIVIVAEGAKIKGQSHALAGAEKDAFGHVRLGGMGETLASAISNANLECRWVNLSHLQRGGAPVAYDRRMGFTFGIAAVQAILAKQYGNLVSFSEGKIILRPLSLVRGPIRCVNLELTYDTENYRAKRSIL